ncbi:uncharacterized protein B0T15DRAFT_493191 [Chaetomium strumarium]|uniref:Uncharacterized protein n=1 Tax=Chaetomium strumarium TaxID=1170767 RepID=A0AAJ0M0Z5_9PEZI|nr:hypothetical protein B0T15DRAFT_493191 [Chaetomium strumarium]
MDSPTNERRAQWYKDLNFGGVSDWAVDLQAECKANSDSNVDIDAMDPSYKCELKDYNNLDGVITDADKSLGECVAMNAIRAFQRMIDKSMSGYDDVFGFYRNFMHDTLSERLCGMMIDGEQPIAGFFDCYYTEGEVGERKDASKYDCKSAQRVDFGKYTQEFRYEQTSGGIGMCFNFDKVHWGFPAGKPDFEVPNPKTVVDKARKNFDTIWTYPADAVEVLAMPVFLLEDAVESIKEVKKIGQDEQRRRTKHLTLKIVEGILFLIPFVGAAIGNLGRNPEIAPVAILAMVLGGLGAGGTRRALRYRELSIVKGKLSPQQKTNLGASFRANNPKVELLTGKICPER